MEDIETIAAELQSAVTPIAQTKAEKAEAVVHSWLTQHIHGSAVAQHTPAYNHLVASLDALKAEIAAIL
jgi:hypothetical protein